MKARASLRDALLWAEGSLEACVALAIARARQLAVEKGGSPGEIEAFLQWYGVNLAEWKAAQLRQLEHELRTWNPSPETCRESGVLLH